MASTVQPGGAATAVSPPRQDALPGLAVTDPSEVDVALPPPSLEALRSGAPRALQDALGALEQDRGLDALAGLRAVARAVREMERHAVRLARRDGATWQEIGDTLGTTRQNAQQRFCD
ncbi:hypothetical protein [Georgenia sp. SUBG003]|uniref:hypothetical protein n=1 Tax=Georgenia sp. SUBG003 TaxID=1497974 RepID=UPI0005BA4585